MTTEREKILDLVATGQLSPADADRLLKRADAKPRRDLVAWLFDPAERLGTDRALLVGLAAVILGGLLARAGIRFDGALDSHDTAGPVPWTLAVADVLVAWPLTALVFWLVSFLVAKQGRLVDHLAAVGVARVPAVLTGAVLVLASALFPRPEIVPGKIPDVHPLWLAFILLSIPFVVWQVALLYRGFRTASGLRGLRCAAAGVAAIVGAEIVSKAALHYLSRLA
jgi:hypothetical protein